MLDRAKSLAISAALKAADTEAGREAVLEPFTIDNRAQGRVGMGVQLVVALFVGALMLAILAPIAIDEIVGADQTDWSDSTKTMWDLLPVIVVLAAVLFFLGVALKYADF